LPNLPKNTEILKLWPQITDAVELFFPQTFFRLPKSKIHDFNPEVLPSPKKRRHWGILNKKVAVRGGGGCHMVLTT